MIAIVSDVHANLEALQAVLADIGTHGATKIYCLGDMIDYGPNPCECLDLLMSCPVCLLGNHEEAVRGEPDELNPEAARGALWTKEQLRQTLPNSAAPEARLRFLNNLLPKHEEAEVLYVHASPREPTREYIYPHDSRDGPKMWDIFRHVPRCCFVGHTHIPGIFPETGPFRSPSDINDYYRLGPTKLLCNVGSVGQPRDDDWRACYVLFDGKTIFFRRVAYNINATVMKMKKVPELQPFLDQYKR